MTANKVSSKYVYLHDHLHINLFFTITNTFLLPPEPSKIQHGNQTWLKMAHDKDTSLVQRTIRLFCMQLGFGLRKVVTRCGKARGTPAARSQSMSSSMPIPDIPSQSRLCLQPASWPQNNTGDCIPPAIIANVASIFDMYSSPPRLRLRAHCKELGKEREDFKALLDGYNIRFQNAEKDILKKNIMLSTLAATSACLQKGQKEHKPEAKSLILANAECINKSKNVSNSASASRYEKIANSVSRHLLSLFIGVEGKI